jgi:hypothetical protein
MVAFADKEVTRMTVWNGEIARAVRLARAAYESRKGRPAPNIIAMRFVEVNGEQITLTGLDLGFALVMADVREEAWPDLDIPNIPIK